MVLQVDGRTGLDGWISGQGEMLIMMVKAIPITMFPEHSIYRYAPVGDPMIL